MGSRLEAVGESKGSDVRLLDEIFGLRAIPGQIDGKIVERVEVLQGLL